MNPAVTPTPLASEPWWRVGMVWLVLAGPALVVLASFATLRLAVLYRDPVIEQPVMQIKAEPALQARKPAVAPKP